MNALSFCEVAHRLTDDLSINRQIIKDGMKAAKFESLDRVYLGSNFCCRYFLAFTENSLKKIVRLIDGEEFSNLKVTLCLPIFSQTYLQKGKQLTEKLLKTYSKIIDEVTVNDFAMLQFVSSLKVKANVGRMMNKDVRDFRYDAYFNSSHTPDIVTLKNSVLDGFDINCFEFDLTNRFLDFKDFDKKVAVYFPYVFATTGHICELSGIKQSVEKKFRANGECNYDCAATSIEYGTKEGEDYVKFGRTLFFKVEDFSVKTKSPYRSVFEVFDLFSSRRAD